MKLYFDKYKQWIQKSNSTFIINELIESNDPKTTLIKFKNLISDKTIYDISNMGFLAYERNDLKESLSWIEISYQASLLKGSSMSLAKCLIDKCFFLLKIYIHKCHELQKAAEDPSINAELKLILQDSLNNIDRGLKIFQEVIPNNEEEISFAYNLKGEIYHYKNDFNKAFEYKLTSILIWDVKNSNTSILINSISDLLTIFKKLDEDALSLSCQRFIKVESILLYKIIPIVDDISKSYIHSVLGISFDKLNKKEESTIHWDKAFVACKSFTNCQEIQLIANKFFSIENIVLFGEKCLTYINNKIDILSVAFCLERLAFAYYMQDKFELSIDTYQKASAYYFEDKGKESLGGDCLIRIAEIEMKLGNIQRAIEVLASCKCSHGLYFFWYVEKTLAELHFKTGSLLKSIHSSERAENLLGFVDNKVFAAHSLNFSAFLYYQVGDFELSFRKYNTLFKLLNDKKLEPTTYYPTNDYFFEEVVTQPSFGNTVYMLVLLSKKLSEMNHTFKEDHKDFLNIFRSLSPDDFGANLPKNYLINVSNEEGIALLEKGMRLLDMGEKMILYDLDSAKSTIQMCIPLIENTDIIPYAYELLGSIEMLCANIPNGIHYCEKSLLLYQKYRNPSREMDVYSLLSALHKLSYNYELSYKYSNCAIVSAEGLRNNINNIEYLLNYSKIITPLYVVHIELCIYLGFNVEAFYMLEKSKSKSLSDLLNQPQRNIIDYNSLSTLTYFKEKISEYDHRELFTSFQERKDEEKKLGYEQFISYLNRKGVYYEQTDLINNKLLIERSSLEIDSHFEALSFEEIRDLCTTIQ